jgi:hypothetical protein
MVSTGEARLHLARDFPALNDGNFGVTSNFDRTYNCIAWAANDNKRWWWPRHPFGYWPDPSAPVEVGSFRSAFEGLGYAVCDNPAHEVGLEKVAIYALNGVPKHAARQLMDGKWTSKLGQNWDIWHDLEALNGPTYGEPILFMSRVTSQD